MVRDCLMHGRVQYLPIISANPSPAAIWLIATMPTDDSLSDGNYENRSLSRATY